jgi:hypothetical protein
MRALMVSSRVAAPKVVSISTTGRVGDGGAEIAGHQLAKVFEVLHGERTVVAGVVDALLPADIRRQAAAHGLR